ncbi:MAG: hypothetical protein IJ682_04655 [Lachnospiraceae bacterium]|nr:hypothetical protein [Lachnospiraceae bacterium]
MENGQQRRQDSGQDGSIFETVGRNLKSLDGRTAPWMVLGLCLPLAGFILCMAWKDTREADAKAAGTGAFLGILVSAALYAAVTAGTMLRLFL